jgi:ABC-type branched-subunit amino acid transport system substrate-binding protein
MFGSNFGALCLGCAGSQQPFIAEQLDKKKVGVIAYNVENSAKCADGIVESFDKYPTADVVFVSKSKAFGDSDFSVEVSQMKDEGVDFVQTCMDTNAVVNLAKEMRRQDLDAIQYLPNGYDHELVEANAEFLDGSLTGTQFAPFETRPKPKGLVDFEKWMKKGNYTQNEVAVMGWLAAAQLTEGLRLAGPNFTRQKVVDELNKQTAYTADGLIPPRDWTTEHDLVEGPVDNTIVCQAYLVVKNGKLTPTFTKPGKPFMCLPARPAKLPAKATFTA